MERVTKENARCKGTSPRDHSGKTDVEKQVYG